MTAQFSSPSLSLACRVALAGAAVLLAILVGAAAAHASVPVYKGSSANGEAVFFETDEQLVPGDTDTKPDVYERYLDGALHTYVTREVSLGPTGGNDAYPARFGGVNRAGDRVFFSTEEQMVEGDTDRRTDVYMRDLTAGTTELVSHGEAACAPGCGNGALPATFVAANETGSEAFFTTAERLSPQDTDNAVDLYVWDLGTGTTELVSQGGSPCPPGCGNGEFNVSSRGISADGSHAYFVTDEQLSSDDGDAATDIYARDLDTDTTSLVSTGSCTPACENRGAVPIFDGSSATGSRVFFSSDEKLSDEDHDKATDIYARNLPGGPTVLVSGGSADTTVSFAAASADGAHVFFTTAEALDPIADTNGTNDIYEWSGGAPQLITPGACSSACGVTFDAISSTASEIQVLFSTAQRLLPGEDTDSSQDIYRQSVAGGAPELVSRGEAGCSGCWNDAFDAHFNASSADASRVVFGTEGGILEEDEDGEDDIYLRDGGTEKTSLITTSPSYCPQKTGSCGASFAGVSEDGLHVFFSSVERFKLEDGDDEADVYERFLGTSPSQEVTRLVSTGNGPNLEPGPPPPSLSATNPGSPGTATALRILGSAESGSLVKIYKTGDCSGETVAAGTAEALASPGLAVTVAAGSLTTFWATAEAKGFVSRCSKDPISYQALAPSGGGGGEGSGGGGGGSSGGASSGAGARPGGGSTPPPGAKYLVPAVRITFAPASKTRSRSPAFRFTDATGQQGTRFECKLDRRAWRRCGSPLRLKKLRRGKHVLQVKAINAAGAVGPTVARRAFRVVPATRARGGLR